MSIETAADAIRSKVSSGGLDSTVKFDCGSDGVIFVDGSEVVTEDKAADCTIKLSLDTLEGLPARRWVPGHGEPATDLAPLRQTRDYLGWLAQTIRAGAESGQDMTELFQTPIPPRFAGLALVKEEFRRSVVHLFPAAERAVLEAARAKASR